MITYLGELRVDPSHGPRTGIHEEHLQRAGATSRVESKYSHNEECVVK